MLNKAMIIGRLGKNPESRDLQNGIMVTMTIATDESYTDRSGQRVEQTEWHKVVCYGKTAEMCKQYLGKGSLAYVEGRIHTRKWTDQSGLERSTKEIICDRVQFLDRRKDEQTMEKAVTMARSSHPRFEETTDDVPF